MSLHQMIEMTENDFMSQKVSRTDSEESFVSTAIANVYMNDAIINFSGKWANHVLGNSSPEFKTKFFEHLNQVLKLPPDLKMAKRLLLSTLSALYSMILIVFALVFTFTELITPKVSLHYFENIGFYTYLYSVSVAFMIYLHFYVLRDKYINLHFEKRDTDKTQFDVNDFILKMSEATGLTVTEISSSKIPGGEDSRRFSIKRKVSSIEFEEEEMSVKLMTSENDKSHGSLFLRLGAVIFGLATLIYTGLEFLTFWEMSSSCRFLLQGLNPILYMIFVTMQMYFIFTHSRININRNKFFTKFGMMHVIATNICIVIRTLVRESAKEILESQQGSCHRVEETIEQCSIYLFPFIIEYSIISSDVVYSMWKNVGKNPSYVLIGHEDDNNNNKQKECREPLDWSNSGLGLFYGLLSLASLIIFLILYFAFVTIKDYQFLAIVLNSSINILFNACMILALILGFHKTKTLTWLPYRKDYDALLLTSALGIVIYETFTLIAGIHNSNSYEPKWLLILNGLFDLIQVNLQIMFITDLRQKIISSEHLDSKPGRQIVTYLLICNFALWITYNFEIQKVNATPDQVDFYGLLPWTVIQRLTLPLCIFFRFHSTVVLTDVWKNCYRIKNKDQGCVTNNN